MDTMISTEDNEFRPRVNFGWIGESFYLFQRDAGVWICATLIDVVLTNVIWFGMGRAFTATGHPPMLSFVAYGYLDQTFFLWFGTCGILGFPVNAFFYSGLLRMANKSVRGEPLSFSDIFSGRIDIWEFTLFSLCVGVFFTLGLLACFLGPILVFALFAPGYALAADGVDYGKALSRSYNAVKTDWLNAATLTFVVGVLVTCSAICLIGTLVTLPMSCIMCSLAYRDMAGMPIEEIPVQAVVLAGSWPPAPNKIQRPDTLSGPAVGQPQSEGDVKEDLRPPQA